MKLDPKVVAQGWCDLQQLSGKSTEHYLGSWADDVVRTAIECDAVYAWDIIKEINKIEKKEKITASFAAGPVEDFLCNHANGMIEQVLLLARQDPKFNYTLGGVWQSEVDDKIWNRIEEIRNHVW